MVLGESNVLSECALARAKLEGCRVGVSVANVGQARWDVQTGMNPMMSSPLENDVLFASTITPARSCSAGCGRFENAFGSVPITFHPL